MRSRVLYMPLFFFGVDCAGPTQQSMVPRAAPWTAPPVLSARVLAKGAQTGSLYQLPLGQPLAANELAMLKVGIERPAYVYVVRYAFGGVSELLWGQDDKQLTPAGELSVEVPRPALRQDSARRATQQLVVLSSSKPLRPALYRLLHLRSPLDSAEIGVRGSDIAPASKDPAVESAKKKDDKKDDRKDEPAKPREEKRKETRGPALLDENEVTLTADPGEGGPVSLLSLVLTYN